MRTQNVRGLAQGFKKMDACFSLTRARERGQQTAVTLLQETHVLETEVGDVERRYRTHWGFNEHAPAMSFWSGSEKRSGGVAILLNPYETADATPAMEECWSEHFIAVTCTIRQKPVLVANAYASQDQAAREQLFDALARTKRVFKGVIVLGGDFNCTQDCALDRSYSATATRHVSSTLNQLLAAWEVADSLSSEIPADPTAEERAVFHRNHHTYSYKVGEVRHSSRLDRVYISSACADWVESVEAVQLGLGCDHTAVEAVLGDPRNKVRVSRPRKLYPPKRCAEAAVDTVIREAIDVLKCNLKESTTDGRSDLELWEQFKINLAKTIRTVEKDAIRKSNAGYKQKVTRLRQRLKALGTDTADQVTRTQVAARLDLTVTEWQTLKSRRLMATHSWGHRTHSKEFFKRVVSRRSDHVITKLEVAEGLPPRRPDDLQNIMADAWSSVLNAEHESSDPRGFMVTPAPTIDARTAAEIDAPFTLAELTKVISRCNRTKSSGPDRLPNAWYRDYADDLAPILLQMANACYAKGIVPQSFGDTTVVCLKKSGSSANPLNYRPISLLNTYYKIYTRLLASRLKPLLPLLVAEAQGGVVPGRKIHDVIDCFIAAQQAARRGNSRALAVLLDIKKAYDSVNREYLKNNVKARGFGIRFLKAITATHAATWATFQVNGLLSRKIRITRGIRQGCPLAPLLCVLLLDLLYRWLLADQSLQDPIPTAPDVEPVAGYADDTALIVAGEHQLPYAQAILDDFAALSGLHVNVAKSVVIRLNAHAGAITESHGMQSLKLGERCRYLGIQVGSLDTAEFAWKLCVEQLSTRLRLAQIKTNTATQRAALAKAIIIPKILFVARHCWPTLPQVEELDLLVRNFMWCGLFSTKTTAGPLTTRGKTWMRQSVAKLPVSNGGIGLPCVRTELMILATTTVGQWMYAATERRRRVVTTAGWTNEHEYVQPLEGAKDCPEARYRTTLWATGREALRSIHGDRLTFDEQTMVGDGARTLLRSGENPWRWHDAGMERDYGAFYRTTGRVPERRSEDDATRDGYLSSSWRRALPR